MLLDQSKNIVYVSNGDFFFNFFIFLTLLSKHFKFELKFSGKKNNISKINKNFTARLEPKKIQYLQNPIELATYHWMNDFNVQAIPLDRILYINLFV